LSRLNIVHIFLPNHQLSGGEILPLPNDHTLEFILEIAQQAGSIMQEVRSSGQTKIRKKAARDLVTDADLKVEAFLIEAISSRFPGHHILSEESSPEISRDLLLKPLWILDPVDGTTNYAHSIPFTACSIAHYFDGATQYGVVHAPFLGETFCGIKGHGAYLNGQRIEVSTTVTLQDALIATGFPYDRSGADQLSNRVKEVLLHCRDLRRLGACSMDICYVACGKLDGYYEDVMPWDMAAANLIAEEAGAKIGRYKEIAPSELPSELNGEGYLVATPGIYADLLAVL